MVVRVIGRVGRGGTYIKALPNMVASTFFEMTYEEVMLLSVRMFTLDFAGSVLVVLEVTRVCPVMVFVVNADIFVRALIVLVVI